MGRGTPELHSAIESGMDRTKRRHRFEALAAEVYEPLQRYVRRRAPAQDVDDIVADTMLTLWRRLDDVPVDAGLPWTLGVARRQIANHRRSNGRRLSLALRIGSQPRPDPEDSNPLDPELEVALANLGEPDREILRLWAWQGMEAAEIGTALGITPNAAAIRLHRAKKKLGENLDLARKEEVASGHSHRRRREEERL